MASNETVMTISVRDLDEVKAEVEGLRARVALARQAFNVVYNCKGAPEQWERGKRILIELQEQYDGIVPLAAPPSPAAREATTNKWVCVHCKRDGANTAAIIHADDCTSPEAVSDRVSRMVTRATRERAGVADDNSSSQAAVIEAAQAAYDALANYRVANHPNEGMGTWVTELRDLGNALATLDARKETK